MDVQTDRTHLESTFSSPKPPTTAAGAPRAFSQNTLCSPRFAPFPQIQVEVVPGGGKDEPGTGTTLLVALQPVARGGPSPGADPADRRAQGLAPRPLLAARPLAALAGGGAGAGAGAGEAGGVAVGLGRWRPALGDVTPPRSAGWEAGAMATPAECVWALEPRRGGRVALRSVGGGGKVLRALPGGRLQLDGFLGSEPFAQWLPSPALALGATDAPGAAHHQALRLVNVGDPSQALEVTAHALDCNVRALVREAGAAKAGAAQRSERLEGLLGRQEEEFTHAAERHLEKLRAARARQADAEAQACHLKARLAALQDEAEEKDAALRRGRRYIAELEAQLEGRAPPKPAAPFPFAAAAHRTPDDGFAFRARGPIPPAPSFASSEGDRASPFFASSYAISEASLPAPAASAAAAAGPATPELFDQENRAPRSEEPPSAASVSSFAAEPRPRTAAAARPLEAPAAARSRAAAGKPRERPRTLSPYLTVQAPREPMGPAAALPTTPELQVFDEGLDAGPAAAGPPVAPPPPPPPPPPVLAPAAAQPRPAPKGKEPAVPAAAVQDDRRAMLDAIAQGGFNLKPVAPRAAAAQDAATPQVRPAGKPPSFQSELRRGIAARRRSMREGEEAGGNTSDSDWETSPVKGR